MHLQVHLLQSELLDWNWNLPYIHFNKQNKVSDCTDNLFRSNRFNCSYYSVQKETADSYWNNRCYIILCCWSNSDWRDYKINTVGFGTTNAILVDRGWMGTGITTHPVGVAVTKVDGAYNIVDNISISTQHLMAYTLVQSPILRMKEIGLELQLLQIPG